MKNHLPHCAKPASWRRLSVIALLFVFALIGGLPGTQPVLAQVPSGQMADGPRLILIAEDGRRYLGDRREFLRRAAADGGVPVIVELAAGYQAEGTLSEAAQDTQQQRIAAVQDTVADELGHAPNLVRYRRLPFLALEASPRQLRMLMNMPVVLSIAENGVSHAMLNETVRTIRAPSLWRDGYNGEDWAIAVIDSGVGLRHRAYRDRIVAEACFSTERRRFGYRSLCENGSTDPGVASACWFEGCDHGTHVAGIALGNWGARGDRPALRGVARGANLIAIQAFSRQVRDCDGGAPPCLMFQDIDVLAAMDHVLTLSAEGAHDIAAVNLSLGTDEFHIGACDAFYPAWATAAAALTSRGIAVVSVSGNRGGQDTVEAPGCLSDVIAVGATTRDGRAVAAFSNAGPTVDLLAPGVDVRAPLPPRGDGERSGTSMAAAHVSGAFTLMRNADPSASVIDLTNALACSGIRVADGFGRRLRPRINLHNALRYLGTNPPDCRTDTTIESNRLRVRADRPFVLTATVIGMPGMETLPEGTVDFLIQNDADQFVLGVRNRPLDMIFPADVTRISAGPSHTCAIAAEGSAYCWGYNRYGQLGIGSTEDQSVPVLVDLPRGVRDVAVGLEFSCAAMNDGRVYCWGMNRYGQIGTDDFDRIFSPGLIDGVGAVTNLTAGRDHVCALTETGEVHCWGGCNGYGCGDGANHWRQPDPVQAVLDEAAVQIAAGEYHTCARTQSGRILCWGRNDYGQIGNGESGHGTVARLPVEVMVLGAGNHDVAAGSNHSCAVSGEGAAYCWGSNRWSQLGTMTDSVAVPTAVQGLASGVAQISAGGMHSCATTVAGEPYCWGTGLSGQLGAGPSWQTSRAPIRITDPALDVSRISAGSDHTCALTASHRAWCWGSNRYGRLGIGDPVTRVFEPTSVTSFGQAMGVEFTARLGTPGTYRVFAVYSGSDTQRASVSAPVPLRVRP